MLEASSTIDANHSSSEGARKTAILVTPMFPGDREADLIGADAYSYHFVYRAFLPLLREIGELIEVEAPESRLDWAAEQARRRGLEPIHLSFRPLQHVYLSSLLPNVAFPFWEFPRIPDEDFADNPRNNWARIADRLSLVLCASDFTSDAFRRAGVRAPVATVPVPIRDEYFVVDAWDRDRGGSLRCETYWLRADGRPSSDDGPPSLRSRARSMHEDVLRPLLPRWANRGIDATVRRVKRTFAIGEEGEGERRWPSSPKLELSGVVYTSLLNPFDLRKNWRDLLSAFVLALADEENATLVVKLVVPSQETHKALALLTRYFSSLGIAHRCRVGLVTGYLSNAELVELTRLSTYYLSATRAEGACLPAQDFLAAGRPIIAPVHSALAEYLSFDVGFPVESHPEPASWPHDPSHSIRTTCHRVVWQSLQEQIWASYVAARDAPWYAAMAEGGRARMREFAAAERVRPRLRQALEPLLRERAAVR